MLKKLKNNFISVLFVLFTIFLVIFSSSNLQAAKVGLELWAKSVVPALLPFLLQQNYLAILMLFLFWVNF